MELKEINFNLLKWKIIIFLFEELFYVIIFYMNGILFDF